MILPGRLEEVASSIYDDDDFFHPKFGTMELKFDQNQRRLSHRRMHHRQGCHSLPRKLNPLNLLFKKSADPACEFLRAWA